MSHIDSKRVRCYHLLSGIDYLINSEVLGSGVGYLAVPSELTVTAGCLIKVEGSFALLVDRYRNACGLFFISYQSSGYSDLLDAGSLIAYEVEALEGSCSVVAEGELDVTFIDCYRLVIIKCEYGKLGLRAVNCVDVGLGEVDGIGNHNVNCSATEDLFAKHNVNINVTKSLCGKNAFRGNSSDAVIADCPGRSLGKLCGVTCCADTACSHLDACADGKVIAGCINACMVKRCGAGSCGYHDQRCTYGTGSTVGRTADNFQCVCTLLLSNVGGRSAAVQVDRVYATCLEHDLSDLFHTTAAGNGLLTSVEYHEYDLTGLGDTDSGTACSLSIIIAGACDGDLSILYEGAAETGDTLCQLILKTLVILIGTDYGSAVLEHSEEALSITRMIFNAAHHKQAAGLTCLHVIACAVDSSNYVVVFNVMLAFGVAVLVLGCISLIKNSLHTPSQGRIVILVVSVNVDVGTGYVTGCNVVSDLLAVCSLCILDLLGDTGCKHGAFAGEYCEVRLFYYVNVVAGQLTDIVCKCIAACFAESVEIVRLKLSRSFKCCNNLVSCICIIYSLTKR